MVKSMETQDYGLQGTSGPLYGILIWLPPWLMFGFFPPLRTPSKVNGCIQDAILSISRSVIEITQDK